MPGERGRRSRVDMLSMAALDAAIEALPEEGATLPLRLSPAVAALQCAISTGALRENHVAVQSIYRLCLQLFKAERSVPSETFDALRSFDESQLVHHGRSRLHMMHGIGGAQTGAYANAREFADELNSGFSSSTEMRIRVDECAPTTVCHCSMPAEAPPSWVTTAS